MEEKMPHPWILAEQTHAFIRAQKWEVAVLPFGATEPHNLHMPYASRRVSADLRQARRTCRRGRDEPRAGVFPTAYAARTRRRRRRTANATRRHQPRLGLHHAALAPGKQEHRAR